jgi:putative ABC transport system permease protein
LFEPEKQCFGGFFAEKREEEGVSGRETLLLALAGIVLGLLAVLAAARVLSSRLYGLSAYDPPALAAAMTVLLVVAIVAGSIPGSRAARVDPTEALRYE